MIGLKCVFLNQDFVEMHRGVYAAVPRTGDRVLGYQVIAVLWRHEMDDRNMDLGILPEIVLDTDQSSLY